MYDIKITGRGTRAEIAAALKLIVAAIDPTSPTNQADEDIDGAEWEDCTLLTELIQTNA